MKNSIIKLHNREDNSVILVNFEDVVVVDTVFNDDRYFSMIYLSVFRDDMEHYFEVNETPEKIFATYQDVAKHFIKLHNSETNLVTYMNMFEVHIIDTIRCMREHEINGMTCEENKCCSKIYPNEDSIEPFVVNETPERIYTMIENYYKTVPDNGQ